MRNLVPLVRRIAGDRPGITITSTAAAQSPVEVFARGLDNALWHRPSMLTIAATGPWASLGGRLTSGMTATTVPGGKTYVFVLGTDNNIWMKMGTWPPLSGWMRL